MADHPVILPLLLAFSAVSLWSIFGGEYSLNLGKLVEFPPILASNFLVNVWEEIGWRGYGLPELQKRYNA